jgi:UDP-N-acetylmuramate--alanine ligase
MIMHIILLKLEQRLMQHVKDGTVVLLLYFNTHTYSRTQEFYKEFAQAFDDADVLVITDVYAARENPIPGISAN